MIKQTIIPACSALLLAFVLGCGGTADVNGAVSYDGKAVERGKIRFLPLDDKGELDGKGMIVGVDINKGKYKAMDVPLGKKKVAILAQELAGQAAAEKGNAGQKQPALPLIPSEVTKDLQVDIAQANQTADFHLRKPQEAAANSGKK